MRTKTLQLRPKENVDLMKTTHAEIFALGTAKNAPAETPGKEKTLTKRNKDVVPPVQSAVSKTTMVRIAQNQKSNLQFFLHFFDFYRQRFLS